MKILPRALTLISSLPAASAVVNQLHANAWHQAILGRSFSISLRNLCQWLIGVLTFLFISSTMAQSAEESGKTTRVVTPDGVALSVHEWGNPNGKEILFIHGFSQSYLSFSKQYSSDLARDFRIIAFDLRGHGESDKPTSLEAYTDGRHWADDVAAVIKSTGMKNPYLVGWSMGGRVISQYLAIHGDKGLAGIVFVSSRTVVEPGRTFLGPGAATLGAMQATGNDANIRATTAFLRECFNLQPSDGEFAYMLGYNMLTTPLARKGTQLWPGKFDEALRNVSVPTLVIHGTKDRIILSEAAEFTAKSISNAKLVWIEGAGHSPFWEKPVEFNSQLRSFVGR